MPHWDPLTYTATLNHDSEHVCTCTNHVHTCTWLYVTLWTCINMSVHGSETYVPFCKILSRWSLRIMIPDGGTGIYQVYIPGIWKWLSYDRYIPGISQSYDIDGHNPGIYQVYTTKFQSMGVPDVRLVRDWASGNPWQLTFATMTGPRILPTYHEKCTFGLA